MNKCCGNCRLAKKRGWKMVFCTFFGIDISASYNKCDRHKGAVILEEGQPIIDLSTTQRRNDLRTS